MVENRGVAMSDMSGSLVDAGSRQRETRHRRLMMARIADGRMRGQDIVIRNISRRGLGAATQGLFPLEGERLSILLPTGPTVTGIVRWCDGPSFGLALDAEMDTDSLADVKRKLKPAPAEPVWEVSRLHRVVSAVRPDPGRLRPV